MFGWPNCGIFYLVSSLFISNVTAELVNRTIDDKYGDYSPADEDKRGAVAYYPEASWWHQGEGSQCPGCAIGTLPGNVAGEPVNFGNSTGPQNGTWHELLNNQLPQDPVIEVTFSGSAIYLYALIFAYSTTNVSVELDGQRMPDFYYEGQQNPITGPKWRYNQLIYASNGLADGNHTVRMTNMPGSEFMFDYATYTADVAPQAASSQTSRSVPVAAIVGAAVGGLVLLGLAIGFFVFLRRRRLQHRTSTEPNPPQPMAYGQAVPFTLTLGDTSSTYIPDTQYAKNSFGSMDGQPLYGAKGSRSVATSTSSSASMTARGALEPDQTSVFNLQPDNTSVFHLRSPS
ncbi:hypothetical protein DL96DRAFT_1716115 [Flagelloscypha sp. PMI_526]|nr:hypothetical protein DL96DRAFT_1716115 [Flagelloscypha sp. PMI_526]